MCQEGTLSKAEDILEWNMGQVLATARILFLRNISRCVASNNLHDPSILQLYTFKIETCLDKRQVQETKCPSAVGFKKVLTCF